MRRQRHVGDGQGVGVSQDKLDTDLGVSIREELMDFLHLVTLLGYGPGPEP